MPRSSSILRRHSHPKFLVEKKVDMLCICVVGYRTATMWKGEHGRVRLEQVNKVLVATII